MEITFDLSEIDTVAKALLKNLKHHVVLLNAPMGTGKTTLIKSLSQALGILNPVSSPTFSIVNEYTIPNSNQQVYHFDLYRLNDEEEAYDMGLNEYLDSGNWCFIEWPEKAKALIPEHHATITLSLESDGKRKLVLIN